MEAIGQDKFHSERLTNSKKESEAFVLKLFEILLKRGKATSAVGDLEVAKEINQAAGQYLSDEISLVSLHLPSKEIKEMIGVDRGFRSNYRRILDALVGSRSRTIRTVGDIRNTELLMLADVKGMQMPSASFIKTIFARPQTAESK